jgi:3-phenylpropionate/trans-cinnamate dioxygenase ferredoxin subunit
LFLIAQTVEESETSLKHGGGGVIFVGRWDDIPLGEAVRVQADVPIAVFNVDGELFAIDDTCTHQDASLADGWLEGCMVECPLHASCFDLRTGLSSGPPAKTPVRTHEVVVDGDGGAFVRVEARTRAAV